MVAAVTTEPTFSVTTPQAVFDFVWLASWNYDVASDGQRIVAAWTGEEEPERIVVIPDFAAELKARMEAAVQ